MHVNEGNGLNEGPQQGTVWLLVLPTYFLMTALDSECSAVPANIT